MSRAFLLDAGIPLVEAVADRVLQDGPDCGDNLVLFPGKRPAHFLRKSLAERIGTAFLPPHVFSIDSFVDWLYQSGLGRHDRNLDEMDAVALLFDIHKASVSKIGGERFSALDDFLPIGQRVFAELEELRMGLVPAHKVRELDSLKLPFSHLASLSEFYDRFYAGLSANGFSTRASRYAAVAESVPAAPFDAFRSIVVAGFFSLTRAEELLFKKLAGFPQTVLLFQNGPGIGGIIGALDVNPVRLESGNIEVAFHFVTAPDLHGEIFAASAAIAEIQNAAGLDEKSVVVLPNPDALFPLLHESLAGVDDARYNVSLGYPLERTPAFAFLNSIMDAITSMHNDLFHAPEYFKLVLHPYAKNILFRGVSAEVTRIMFHTIEEEWADTPAKSFFALEQIEEADFFDELATKLGLVHEAIPEDSIDAVELRAHLKSIHDRLLRPFLLVANVAEFCNQCVAVLEYIHDESTANRHIYFQPFVQTLAELLETLGRSLLAGHSFRDPAGYVNFVRNCITGGRVPFEGTPLHGLQVLGFLETRNLAFERVIVLDANEDVFPGSRATDMLLPRQIRESLGLATYRDHERLVAYYFHLLIRSAKEVTFLSIAGAGKERSRFVEAVLWEKQRPQGAYDSRGFTKAVKYEVSLETRLPSPIPKSSAVIARLNEMVFNATLLDTYMACQLKMYYGNIAGLHEKAGVSEGPDQRDIGTLIHNILSEYYKNFKSDPLSVKKFDRASLDAVVARLFTEKFGDEPKGMKFLLRQQIGDHLWSFIENYQLPLLNQHKKISIAGLERKFGATRSGYEFKGFADRVELRDGTYVILDYKTGANEAYYAVNLTKLVLDDRSSWAEAIHSFQLPLYALMYSEANGIPIEKIRPAYLMIGRNLIDDSCEVPLFEEGEGTSENYALLGSVVDALVKEITDPAIPFSPTEDPESNCPRCPYNVICGTQWIKGR